jgi:hypothetical protein
MTDVLSADMLHNLLNRHRIVDGHQRGNVIAFFIQSRENSLFGPPIKSSLEAQKLRFFVFIS